MTTKKKYILLSVLVLGIITPLLALGIAFAVSKIALKENTAVISSELRESREQNIYEGTLGGRDGAGQRKFSPENFRGESGNVLPGITVLEINDAKIESSISGPMSVYDFMDKLRDEGRVNFTEKTYIGMGKFIDSIGGVRPDGENTWIFYVNGVKAETGISNQMIKPGDVVTWKFEKLLAY